MPQSSGLRHMVFAFVLTTSAGWLNPVPAVADWQAGFSRVVITPEKPMWLSGYGSRNHASEGKIHDLYARAAALQDDGGKRVVMISLDLVGVPKVMAERVSAAAKTKHKLERADLMFCCSHTHCGPALDQSLTHMLDMKEEDWQQVRDYQLWQIGRAHV